MGGAPRAPRSRVTSPGNAVLPAGPAALVVDGPDVPGDGEDVGQPEHPATCDRFEIGIGEAYGRRRERQVNNLIRVLHDLYLEPGRHLDLVLLENGRRIGQEALLERSIFPALREDLSNFVGTFFL